MPLQPLFLSQLSKPRALLQTLIICASVLMAGSTMLCASAQSVTLGEATLTANEVSTFTAISAHPDGGALLAGSVFGEHTEDGWVLRINESGQEVWSQTYHLGDHDAIRAIRVLADGSAIFAGYNFDRGLGHETDDAWLVKIDIDGNVVWSARLDEGGDDRFLSVDITPNGDILAVGYTVVSEHPNQVGWIVKFNPMGQKIWSQTFDRGLQYQLLTVSALAEGGALITGNLKLDESSSSSILLLRVDDAGGLLSSTSLQREGMAGTQIIADAVTLPSGDVMLAGMILEFAQSSPPQELNLDGWVVKVDETGQEIWQRRYGGDEMDSLTGISALPDGDMILSGSHNGLSNGWVIRIDASGEEVLARSDAEWEGVVFLGHAINADGDIMLVGMKDIQQKGHGYFVKIDNIDAPN